MFNSSSHTPSREDSFYASLSTKVRPDTHILPTTRVLRSPITTLRFEQQISQILIWAKYSLSKAVCVANVHMLMEAFWDSQFRKVLENADLVTPDGMPLVRMIQVLGSPNQDRVAGMDIFMTLCEEAPAHDVSVFFLGSDQETLSRIRRRLSVDFPSLDIAGIRPLPFRKMTDEEDKAVVDEINNSGAGLVFIALGCPKQEKWIANHCGKVQATMLGLGYVFAAYAGIHRRAPKWVQVCSLEWAYRLMQEPRRLWKRYILTIPPFLVLAMFQILKAFSLSTFQSLKTFSQREIYKKS